MEDIALGAHLLTLFYIFAVMLVADYIGFGWFRGTSPTLGLPTVKRLHTLMWIGLVLLVATGVFVFWSQWSTLIHSKLFWIKIGFVIALFLNAFFIGRLMHIATVRTFASLSRNEKILFLFSGLLSLMAWVGTAITELPLF